MFFQQHQQHCFIASDRLRNIGCASSVLHLNHIETISFLVDSMIFEALQSLCGTTHDRLCFFNFATFLSMGCREEFIAYGIRYTPSANLFFLQILSSRALNLFFRGGGGSCKVEAPIAKILKRILMSFFLLPKGMLEVILAQA